MKGKKDNLCAICNSPIQAQVCYGLWHTCACTEHCSPAYVNTRLSVLLSYSTLVPAAKIISLPM